MLRRILVATDFSQGASAALDRALRLPLAADARVDVVHVLGDDADATQQADATAHLEREVARARDAARGTATPIAAGCTRGSAYVEIARGARARDAELIVIGVHGTRRFRDLFIGSTAARVVRTSDTPVLLVRSPAPAAYRSALIAAALTDTDRRLFQLAAAIGVSRPEVVHAVHVPFENLQASTAAARGELRATYCATATAKLRGALEAVAADHAWHTTVEAGDPRSVVLEAAARSGTELLICGTHGRSGLAHVLLGSVAETLITSAPCDVLVARPTRFTFELP